MARAASAAAAAPLLRPASPLDGIGDATGPTELEADRATGRIDGIVEATGGVTLVRPGVRLKADHLVFDQRTQQATARGGVRIEREGSVYTGDELVYDLRTEHGRFRQLGFDFQALGAGGDARELEFLDRDRARAIDARYTSCPRDGSGDPDWLLTADRVTIDNAAAEGIADGARLKFLGVTILAAPTISFPLSDARKSGWLPPTITLDNRSGLMVSVPYYWNIAPEQDATFTPHLSLRRGLGLDSEYRRLGHRYDAMVGLDLWPHDRVTGRDRYAGRWSLLAVPGLGRGLDVRTVDSPREGWIVTSTGQRVSDDDWWKDFPRGRAGLVTPRLLSQRLDAERAFDWRGGTGLGYVRVQHWQVLQTADLATRIVAPYQRSPLLGLRWGRVDDAGWSLSGRTEMARFSLPGNDATTGRNPGGWRWSTQAQLGRRWSGPAWWIEPGVKASAAWYANDEAVAGLRRDGGRVIPTGYVDAGMTFERTFALRGRDVDQILEPRVRLSWTPYRNQANLPNYDSAGRDFTYSTIYDDNDWTGSDRVADARRLTIGATTRFIDRATGAQIAQLGIVQRALLADERVAPSDVDPAAIAPPVTQRWSDLLLAASTSIVPRWTFDGTVRYDAAQMRPIRSRVAARYSPGEFRTLAATYSLTRGQSEQLDIGWQWPLGYLRASSTGGCGGRLYSVGRVNWSMRDSRMTDSLLGLEYDSGCWIGRVVAERVSTGQSEATTRLMLQLELVGLSRLGTNPLRVLKDNIPGYRLLRDER